MYSAVVEIDAVEVMIFWRRIFRDVSWRKDVEVALYTDQKL